MTRRKLLANVDDRAQTMSDAARLCRSIGTHATVLVPVQGAEKRQLARIGQRKRMMRCVRGCTYWRWKITLIATGELVAAKSGYGDPGSYLIQEKGTGRMSQASAEVAYYAYGGKD